MANLKKIPLSKDEHDKAMTQWRNGAIEAKKLFERPTLGAKFYITAQMLKGGIINQVTQWYKEPLEKPYPMGIYVGYRAVFNGYMETFYEQESWEHPRYEIGKFFVRRESLEVWLFVVNPRHNPIRVFPKDVIPND